MRLIDADALDISGYIKGFHVWDFDAGWNAAVRKIADYVGAVPTIDAVQVCRCKDCKHYWKNVNTFGYSDRCTTVSDNDFCSHGERKEGDSTG